MWKVYLLEFITVVIIASLWVRGIDKMKEQYPDYKGHDFLEWDDDRFHTEDKL